MKQLDSNHDSASLKDTDNVNEVDYNSSLLQNNTNKDSFNKLIKKKKDTTIFKKSSSEYSDSRPSLFLTADKYDIFIIKELLQDPQVQTLEISIKLGIPFSFVHKKRRIIESKLLQKQYFFDLGKLGLDFRFADVLANIDEEKVSVFTKKIMKTSFKKNILQMIKIKKPLDVICIKALYQNSDELFYLIDKVKSYPYISNVCFSEQVELLGDNTLAVIFNILGSKDPSSPKNKT